MSRVTETMRSVRAIVASLLFVLTMSCGSDGDPVPQYALFHGYEGIGEVGNGKLRRSDGSRSEFYYFAPTGPVERARSDVFSRLREDGWKVSPPPDGEAGVVEAISMDGNTCLRYVSLEGDYSARALADQTLSLLDPDGTDRIAEYGAVIAVIIERDCSLGE